MATEIYYSNDKKEKRQSHGVFIEIKNSDGSVEAAFNGAGLGGTKVVAIAEAKRMVAEMIEDLHNINWEILNKEDED